MSKKIHGSDLDDKTKTGTLDNLETEIELPYSSVSCTRVKKSFEELHRRLFITSYRNVRKKVLIVIWSIGFLKRKQSENNNEFIAKFVTLSSCEKQSLLAQTSHSQLICAFSLSSDTTLSDLLSHCSERAAKLMLADILHARLNNNIDAVKCAKSQDTLLKRIEQFPF